MTLLIHSFICSALIVGDRIAVNSLQQVRQFRKELVPA